MTDETQTIEPRLDQETERRYRTDPQFRVLLTNLVLAARELMAGQGAFYLCFHQGYIARYTVGGGLILAPQSPAQGRVEPDGESVPAQGQRTPAPDSGAIGGIPGGSLRVGLWEDEEDGDHRS